MASLIHRTLLWSCDALVNIYYKHKAPLGQVKTIDNSAFIIVNLTVMDSHRGCCSGNLFRSSVQPLSGL
jgi:hypothetical protein